MHCTAVYLHDVDAHARPFAQFVEPFAVGIDVVQRTGVTLLGPQGVDVVAGRLQVVAGVDREHQHVHQSRFDGHPGHRGIVAAHADMPDPALLPESLRNADDLPVEDAVKIRLGVDVVDHAHVEAVRPQLLQLEVE